MMKNTYFTTIFLLTISCASYAQFRAGIKAGGNFTNVMGVDGSGNKAEGHKFVPGFHVGAIAQLDVAEFVSLQTEVVYSTKGYKLQKSTSTTISNTTVVQDYNVLNTYSYLDVPFLVNIHFGQMGSYVGLGPQLSFLMGAKWDGKSTNTTTVLNPPNPPQTSSVDVTLSGNDKTGYAKVDFGFVIGTGSKWESGIEYCLRAGYGVTNMLDPSATANSGVYHNLAFTVSLGYTFGAGGGGGGDRYGHKYSGKKRRR